MVDLQKISNNRIKNAKTNKVITLESLWKDHTTVIVFFRRWGCFLCRLWAKEVSAIADILEENNIRLIGVGVEDFQTQEFLDENLFKGELYTDIEKKTYSGLDFKRYSSIFSLTKTVFTKESRSGIQKARKMKLIGPSNIRGDALQNGGALVVKKGGELLYYFKQEGPGQHVKNSKFLEVLGLPIPENIDEETV